MDRFNRNAVIMAAGMSSRFVPLSSEYPKGLLTVKGEVLIERQIRQLRESGIKDITIIVGYKSEMFEYLRSRYDIDLVKNEDYSKYNNTSSIIRVLDRLGDTFICSSDNYFSENVFADNPTDSYYSARYALGNSDEYCISSDKEDIIRDVTIGGCNSWYMIGHVYFSRNFSEKFKDIFIEEYKTEQTRLGYWEDVFIRHIDDLPKMKIRRYEDHIIEEFDSLDELRNFDKSYIDNTRSATLRMIAQRLYCNEGDLSEFKNIPHAGDYLYFTFKKNGAVYEYNSRTNIIIQK